MCKCKASYSHLEQNEVIIVEYRLLNINLIVWITQKAQFQQNRYDKWLPVWEENYGFYHEKFPKGIIWLKLFLDSHVEIDQAIKCNCDWDIVDDWAIEISRFQVKQPIIVLMSKAQDNSHNRCDRLDKYKLNYALLYVLEEFSIQSHRPFVLINRERVFHPLFFIKMLENNILTSNILNKQSQENIDHIGLITILYCFKVELVLLEQYTQECLKWIYGNNEYDSDYIQLQTWLVEVEEMVVNVSERDKQGNQ